MKKVLFAAAAVFAFGFANAQDSSNMSFGVKGGLNMSNYTGDADTDSKIGFFVGGFAEFKVTEKFAVQPELLFSALGAKDNDFDESLNANYILVPVMAKFYVTEKFNLEAGPQVGFLMSAKIDGEDVKDAFKSTDFAFNLGAGFDVTENLNVGLRYSLGLSNVSDFDGADIKTSNIGLGLGYKF